MSVSKRVKDMINYRLEYLFKLKHPYVCLNSHLSTSAIHAELPSNIGEQCWRSFILTYGLCQCCTVPIRLITFTNTVALRLCPDFGRDGWRKRD